MKSKSEVFEKVTKYVNVCENRFKKRVKNFRCDQGEEYTSTNLNKFCKKKGINVKYTPRYTPQLNGVTERINRTLIGKIVTMLYDAKLPRYL